MTCASCNITVRKALTNLDGVREAEVTFEPPRAVVRFDASRVSVEELTRATTNVGYPSRLKTSS
ncbi:MAG: cation transporter [Rhodothermales bacterium]